MTDKLVEIEHGENGVCVVWLNRPHVRNALNIATRKALAEAFTSLHDDTTVRAIVLAGRGPSFAAGADLKEFVDADPIEIMKRRTERYWGAVAATPQPVIAAVHGFALGGGLELAMACDLIFATESAKMGQSEVKVGIMPGAGGTQRLARSVGKFQAMKLCLTGAMISADDAYRMGLVCEVVPDDALMERALACAGELASLPPLAVMQTKEAILAAENTSLDAGLALERKSLQLLFATRDQEEGMRAFFDKRKPEFKGE